MTNQTVKKYVCNFSHNEIDEFNYLPDYTRNIYKKSIIIMSSTVFNCEYKRHLFYFT